MRTREGVQLLQLVGELAGLGGIYHQVGHSW